MKQLRRAADLAVAAAVVVATLVTTVAGPSSWEGRLDPMAVLMAGVAGGALAVRRRWPVPVLLVTAFAAEVYLVHYHGRGGTLILAAPLIAVYTVAEHSDRRRALVISGLAVLALGILHVVIKPASWAGAENVALAALGGLAIAAGEASRHRRAYLAELEERARRAEWEREEQARRLLTEERLRIARDLHDAVGHHLALINVQAGVTAYVVHDQPPPVAEALTNIRQASRCALEELRDTIGLLREPGEQLAPVDPTLGLAGLDDLVSAFRRSGLRVERDTSGAVRPLGPAADVTAYRVIQESLTNVCKHASGEEARLRLEYLPERLCITVENGGPVRDRPAGYGLRGMRERVAAIGGTFSAGPHGGGFRVLANLPAPGSRA